MENPLKIIQKSSLYMDFNGFNIEYLAYVDDVDLLCGLKSKTEPRTEVRRLRTIFALFRPSATVPFRVSLSFSKLRKSRI